MLVTSRALLHLNLEREYMVPPLAAPETLTQVSTGKLSRYEAVQLSVERARVMNPSFALTDENAAGSILRATKRRVSCPARDRLRTSRPRRVLKASGIVSQGIAAPSQGIGSHQRLSCELGRYFRDASVVGVANERAMVAQLVPAAEIH